MYSEQQLSLLRDKVRQNMHDSRFVHTLSVEREVERMGLIYLPECVSELRAAAILHDLTKGYRADEQIALCESLGIPVDASARQAPEVLHGLSAAKIIEKDLPLFATPNILEAIRVHTTAGVGMSVFSLILFVADFIEEGRQYTSCKVLREQYWTLVASDKSLKPLYYAALQAIKFTLEYLNRENLLIAPKTLDAMQDLEKLIDCEDLSC